MSFIFVSICFVSSVKFNCPYCISGRFYDGHLLDMVEFGIENYAPLSKFKVGKPHIATQILT